MCTLALYFSLNDGIVLLLQVDTETQKLIDELKEKAEDPPCKKCKDDPAKLCKECGCNICAEKGDPQSQLMCDECEYFHHYYCLDPPLEVSDNFKHYYYRVLIGNARLHER